MCKWGTNKEVKLYEPQATFFPKGIPKLSEKRQVQVDACIASLIQMLNDYGVKTLASCCGHGKTSFSYIRISAQNIDLIPMGDEITIHLKFRYKNEEKKN